MWPSLSDEQSKPFSGFPPSSVRWRDHTFVLDRPQIVGVINVTPDSYHEPSRHITPASVVDQARRMVAEGADALDIGAESSRPGASWVSQEEERCRLLPALEALLAVVDVPISVDTRRPAIADAALSLGAHAINDITAARDEEMFAVVAKHGAGLCLMHMQGESSATMQNQPTYRDVLAEVAFFLQSRSQAALNAGVRRDQIMWDPGLGFGKTWRHNSCLMTHYADLAAYGYPAWLGVSRKSMFKVMLDLPVTERLSPTLAATCLAVKGGVRFIRTHDVRETQLAIAAALAIIESGRV